LPPDRPPAEAVHAELLRVVASTGFARNERLSRFLRFVVERHLEGRDGELKESVVGIEVFGRKPGFDPKVDSTVRSEAARLRSRLTEYYAGEGRTDAVCITLPKGGYVPQVDWAQSPGPATSRSAKPSRSAVLTSGIIAIVFVLGGVGWWWLIRPSPPITIAVLPLQNLSGDTANEYFADGLTDELIRNLALIDGLAPRSRTSSFAFKDRRQPLRDVGRQLQADYVLEGSVLRSGGRLRVDVQLVRVRDDRPFWSGRFDREVTDVVAIQDEISRGIVNSLRLSLGRGRRRYETSFEAYDMYLRARANELQRGFPAMTDSVDAFQAVIAKDPLFAPAYAALAKVHAARSQQFRFDAQREVGDMRAAAEKASELDPLLAEAHQALGVAFARDAQWERSEKSFRRAIELDHNNAEAHSDYALRVLFPLGRIDEALHQFAIAESLDPVAPEIQYQMVYVLLAASRFDEAATHCGKLPADFWGKDECTGRVRLGQGKIAEAIQVL